MKFKGIVEPKGTLNIQIIGPDGRVKESKTVHNLVVTKGKEFIAGRMINNNPVISHMAIGTGSTAPAISQTALVIQTGRVAISGSNAVGASATYSATFPAGTGTGAIVEAGLFDAASGGNMIARTVFGVITKGAEDIMAVTWTITVQ